MMETSTVRANNRVKGVLAPVVTPFTSTLEPDFVPFLKHCRWLLAHGAALAIFGTNSEAASISAVERLRLTDALLEAGIPAERMMPGTGACAVSEATILTDHAVKNGAAGVLMLPPFYYKGVSDDGLFAYYAEVIERVGDSRLAIYLYHIPQFTQVPITLSLIERLLKRYPGVIAGAKDSSGDWGNSKAMIEAFGADGFDVFPASESLLTKALAIGAAGCISATVNVNPGVIHALFAARGTERMAELQEKADRVRRIFQTTTMIPAMKRVIATFSGRQDWAIVRPPLDALPVDKSAMLLADLEAVGFAMPGLPRY